MPSFYHEDILDFSDDQLYKLVADIEDYPQFVPWCNKAQIIERNDDIVLADLFVNFKGITGKYTSRVLLDYDKKEISVESTQGVFEYLHQGWKFIKVGNKTRVEFDINFKVRNKLLNKIIGIMFDQACIKMITAFKSYAIKLYCKES